MKDRTTVEFRKDQNHQISRATLSILRGHVDDVKARNLICGALNLNPRSKRFTHGKVVRGTITMILLGDRGIPNDLARHLAGLIEMVHRASLVADDLQDGHPNRYGKPSFWKQEGISVTVSVLMHLALMVLGALDPQYLTQFGVSLTKARRVHSLFLSQLLSTNIGQVKDVCADQERISLQSYLTIAGLKTAGLFELIGELSAILSIDKGHTDKSVALFLHDLGIVHQIRDDLNELYELIEAREIDPDQLGKLTRGLPYALYLDSFGKIVTKRETRYSNKIREGRTLLKSLSSPDHVQRCEEFCGESYKSCIEEMERSLVSPRTRRRLREISDFLATARY